MMMKVYLIFVLQLIYFNGYEGSILTNRIDDWISEAPALPEFYHVKGVLSIPYAELEEPFEGWVDMANSRSRIDYYDGMMKTYQLGSRGSYGISRKVVPMTISEKEANVKTCFEVSGGKENPIGAQSLLPDISQFKFVAKENTMGHLCERWELIETIDTRVNTYTLWLRREQSVDGDRVIPVKYQMLGFNSLLGSHYDHYYLFYSQFSDSPFDPSVFDLDTNLKCRDFPGPGVDYVYTQNPMKEFIQNYDKHVDNAFEEFKGKYKKAYDNEKEHAHRKSNFRQNMRFIHSKNRASLTYTMASNHLADFTVEELKFLRGRKYTAGYNGGQAFSYSHADASFLPENWDWRIAGAVTPVKDQSVCGSCWSFGMVGALEGTYFLKTGRRVRLSQQALIDCSWGFGNNGCDGGEDFRSYQWMMKSGGLPSEESYGPYLGADGYCHVWNTSVTAVITGYVNVTSGDSEALKVALVNHGPISVAIDAGHRSFSFYSNGVYYEPTCNNNDNGLDHAVLLVGYGTLHGEPYWLIKNSWSTYWGNDGYVLMSTKNNNCGVATMPTYPIM